MLHFLVAVAKTYGKATLQDIADVFSAMKVDFVLDTLEILLATKILETKDGLLFVNNNIKDPHEFLYKNLNKVIADIEAKTE